MDKYSYTKEKLSTSVRLLAVGKGDIRSRLNNISTEILLLSEKDFPDNLKKDWAWIEKELTKHGPTYDYKGDIIGSVANTMSHIYNSTGVKIAKRICDLNYRVQELNEKY